MPTMGMSGQSINGDSSAVSTTDTTLPAVSAGSTPVSASLSDEAAATNQLPVAVPPPSANVASNNPTAATQTELAMQGFCPVTVVREDKWVEGKPEFGVIHLGKLYLFTNQEAMQTFLSDPIPYTPVLNEIDAVVFFEERRIVPGKREWGLKDPIYGRMFFFADEASMNHFYNQYERYTKAAIEVMDKAVKEANPSS
jgi:protein disulfide-isomerase